jgi:hypothetical protein
VAAAAAQLPQVRALGQPRALISDSSVARAHGVGRRR